MLGPPCGSPPVRLARHQAVGATGPFSTSPPGWRQPPGRYPSAGGVRHGWVVTLCQEGIRRATVPEPRSEETGMSGSPPKFRGVSDLREFFRTNQTPIYFVSPTAFNLLGIDRWLRNFFYVNYFDSFEGSHPRVFVPRERPYREFESMEDVCNYLLGHKEVLDRVKSGGAGGKAVFVMFDDETEAA